jgi:hypothetical protein
MHSLVRPSTTHNRCWVGFSSMPDDQIVLCFDCGTKNRIRLGIAGMAKCGNCGAALPVPQADGHFTSRPTPKCNRPADAQEQASSETSARPGADGGMSSARSRGLFVLAVICGLSLAAWWQDQGGAESPAAPPQASTGSRGAQAQASPNPIYQHPGVMYNRTGRSSVAPL